MKRIGIATLVGGGVAVIVSLFLHYVVNTSVWQLTTRYPVVITISAVAAIGLAVASLAVKTPLLLAVATAASAFILGEAFPLGDPSYHYQLGFWLAVGGSTTMILGGMVAIAASVKESQRAGARGGRFCCGYGRSGERSLRQRIRRSSHGEPNRVDELFEQPALSDCWLAARNGGSVGGRRSGRCLNRRPAASRLVPRSRGHRAGAVLVRGGMDGGRSGLRTSHHMTAEPNAQLAEPRLSMLTRAGSPWCPCHATLEVSGAAVSSLEIPAHKPIYTGLTPLALRVLNRT